MISARILVVDDDNSLLKFIMANLRARHYEVMTAQNGAEALDAWQQNPFDLIILDLMMPVLDGLEVVREVRRHSVMPPIIVLSAISEETSKVEAFRLGADDYLTKPFGLQELLARVEAVLRRAGWTAEQEVTPDTETVTLGNLHANFNARRVTIDGAQIHLTPTEYALLRELIEQRNHVLTQDRLLTRVWGPEYQGSSQYLHIYIGRLRQKLANADSLEIVTEPGVGYCLKTSVFI
ncbi:MAG: response regulator transcription factor [Chloroflexota bacterium]